MTLLSRLACLALLLGAFSIPAHAQDASDLPDGKDVKGGVDHPQIQRFKGSSIRWYQKKAFDEVTLALSNKADGKNKTKSVEGQRTTIVYVMPKDLSPLEAIRAYQAELAKLGPVTVLFQGANAGGKSELGTYANEFVVGNYGAEDPQSRWMSWNNDFRYAAMQVKRADGDMYVAIYAGFNVDTSGADGNVVPLDRTGVRLDIVEPKPMVARMTTVPASEMSAEIAKNGRVALYGILFDTGKTDTKPESVPSLTEIAKLMKADPKLRLLVVGHTDTVGAFESNRDLSQRRAKSVVAALVAQYHVDAARLQSFGASYAAPVASNAAEAGRAKNRRVELVAF
jgi:OOP family OmpA-OmpF porin